jgi:FkbM family methyltransferase
VVSPLDKRNILVQGISAFVSIVQTLRLHDVGFVDRLSLVNVATRAWLRRGERDHHLSFSRGGTVHLARESLNADWNVFSEIFLSRCYNSNYRSAIVLDIGAHKGYFGAFAFLGGAQTVISYEPERQNFAYLGHAASSFREMGHDWRVEKKAVATNPGEAELNVSGESWTHSLLKLPEGGSRRAVAMERVETTTLHELLANLATHGTGRVVIKIDVEGSECDLILGTESAEWDLIDELFVEIHPDSTCSGEDIALHLESAGLIRQTDSTVQITHLKRR